jgi:hypothetical protein
MVIHFPVSSRDVAYQTPPGREKLNYSPPGRVWLMTSRLEMGKWITFFTVYTKWKRISASYTLSQPHTAQVWSVKGEYSIIVHLYKRGGRVEDEGVASPADRAAGVSYSHPHHSTPTFYECTSPAVHCYSCSVENSRPEYLMKPRLHFSPFFSLLLMWKKIRSPHCK